MNLSKKFFVFVALLCLIIFFYPIRFVMASSSMVPIEKSLKEKYSLALQGGPKIKILIVPGHDISSGGAEFRGIKESDLVVTLAKKLKDFLAANSAFEAILARDDKSYNPLLEKYFEIEKESINKFIQDSKEESKILVSSGVFEVRGGVVHTDAIPEMAFKLYGINKYANDNDIDLVIHIHFNDYYRRKDYNPGDYRGISIYVPDDQFKNSDVSKKIAESVLNELNIFWPTSNLLEESQGIIPDQKLIAVGSHNTLNQPAFLIEYGYIYETQFRSKKIRGIVLEEQAFRTYNGLMNFFSTQSKEDENLKSKFLSPIPKTILRKDEKNVDVLRLQAALSSLKFYPPKDLNKYRCPIDGVFGKCTLLSVKEFQKINKLKQDGIAGPKTIKKINEFIISI